ncbi:bifunctional precorrin-2 dehydrogenase/sirohydrochlorin ferrochelatase [Oceanobacillus sp. CFH 90083]|uniref:precorrin-2 dehydrogenase/sirohydrochlorin ferrochelatase family protein n=1 Tax=Oceanobacillus sp. CFH 90083 TaxID=2592336 RepID=UPI00128AF7F8|nr:NAD(P)-dependent oxidoreductase [Oceanobacillus sp. CFH 90083]
MQIPLFLEITNQTVIAVGGGAVAVKKVSHFLEAGADITIIAPSLHPFLQQLYQKGEIQWQEREAHKGEQFDCLLLLLMTDKEELNRSLYESKQPHQLVYVANDAQNSDLSFPSVLKQGRLTIALSTGGASPIYARQLKNKLAEQLPEEIEADLAFLDQARKSILSLSLIPAQKKQLLQHITTEEFLRLDNRQELLKELITAAE